MSPIMHILVKHFKCAAYSFIDYIVVIRNLLGMPATAVLFVLRGSPKRSRRTYLYCFCYFSLPELYFTCTLNVAILLALFIYSF